MKRKKIINTDDCLEELEALGLPPNPPMDPIMIVPEPTFPALVIHLSKSVPSVGVFSSEGGQLVGGYAMKEENLLNTAAGFSSLWDKGEINRARVSDGIYNLYGKRVSLNLMIQPVVAGLFFSNKILHGQGFFARCLTCWPESTIGNRPYQKENIFENDKMKTFRSKVIERLDSKLPLIIENERRELRPKCLLLDRLGYECWVDFHDDVEKNMLSGGCYFPIKAFASKIPDNVLRIVGILFSYNSGIELDCFEKKEIPCSYIINAIEIGKFYLSETLRLHGISQINLDLVDAQKLLDWILEKNLKKFPTSLIYQKGPSSIREAKTTKKLLSILKDHGWISGPEEGVFEGKTHSELWILLEDHSC